MALLHHVFLHRIVVSVMDRTEVVSGLMHHSQHLQFQSSKLHVSGASCLGILAGATPRRNPAAVNACSTISSAYKARILSFTRANRHYHKQEQLLLSISAGFSGATDTTFWPPIGSKHGICATRVHRCVRPMANYKSLPRIKGSDDISIVGPLEISTCACCLVAVCILHASVQKRCASPSCIIYCGHYLCQTHNGLQV